MLLLGIAFLPLIQLGWSFYASGATALAIVLGLRFWRAMIPRLTIETLLIILFAGGMFISLLAYPPSRPTDAALRVGREAFFFVALAIALPALEASPPRLSYAHATRWLTLISIGISAFVLLQTFSLARGVYIGVPREMFVQNAETIPDLLALRYTRVRPAATFGEPSYLGFICTSIILMLSPVVGRSRHASIGALAACLAGILSQSLSFLLAATALSYLRFFRRSSPGVKILFLTIGTAITLAAIELGAIGQRFGGGSGADSSTTARLVAPLQVLGGFLSEHPFGVNYFDLTTTLAPKASAFGFRAVELLHNGLYNMFFCYGFLAFGISTIIFLRIKDPSLRLYLISCAMFNGAFFQIDKVAVIFLTYAVYSTGRLIMIPKSKGNSLPSARIGEFNWAQL